LPYQNSKMNTRSIRLNIPEIIEEYIIAKASGDSDECTDIRERFERVFETSTQALRDSMRRYVDNVLAKTKINHTKELDNLFSSLFLEKKEV